MQRYDYHEPTQKNNRAAINRLVEYKDEREQELINNEDSRRKEARIGKNVHTISEFQSVKAKTESRDHYVETMVMLVVQSLGYDCDIKQAIRIACNPSVLLNEINSMERTQPRIFEKERAIDMLKTSFGADTFSFDRLGDDAKRIVYDKYLIIIGQPNKKEAKRNALDHELDQESHERLKSFYKAKKHNINNQVQAEQTSYARYKTEGKGDCAFHAIFGEWEQSEGQFICKDVATRRQVVANAIRAYNNENNPSLPEVVKRCLERLVTETREDIPNVGEEIAAVKEKYKEFKEKNNARINTCKIKLESELQKHQNIIDYIEVGLTKEDKVNNISLFDKFSKCLNDCDSTEFLKKQLLERGDLKEAYEQYKEQAEVKFIFKYDDGIINEYAALIGRPGYWLLSEELEIIAWCFDITIELYINSNQNKKVYGAGEGTAKIYFNGLNHYEKIDVTDRYNVKQQEVEMLSSKARIKTKMIAAAETIPNLSLPEGFTLVGAHGDGNYFFDACAQGLQAILNEYYTTEDLCRLCSDYMERLQRKNEWKSGNWIYHYYITRLRNSRRFLRNEDVVEKAQEMYLKRQQDVAWSVEDKITLGFGSDEAWAEHEIDGRVICEEINEQLSRNGANVKIKIHTIEVSGNIKIHHLITEEGEEALDEGPRMNAIWQNETTLHIVCYNSHWQIILSPKSVFEAQEGQPATREAQMEWGKLLELVSDFMTENMQLRLKNAVTILQLPVCTVPQLLQARRVHSDYEARLEQLLSRLKLYSESNNDDYQICQSIRARLRMELNTREAEFINLLSENKENKMKLKELFFSDVALTDRDISKRVRELSLLLHPDKHGIDNKYFSLLNSLFSDLNVIATSLRMECGIDFEKINEYKGKALEYWEKALDYQNASKKTVKPKRLTRESLNDLTSRGCESLKKESAFKAYKEYQVAVRAIDKEVKKFESGRFGLPLKLINDQIELRNSMALALYLSGSNMYAELYVLSALRLLSKHPSAAVEQYKDSLKILEKIKGNVIEKRRQAEVSLPPSTPNETMNAEVFVSSTASTAIMIATTELAIIKSYDGTMLQLPASEYQKDVFATKTNSNIASLALLATRLLITPDAGIIDFEANKAVIKATKERAVMHITKGVMYTGLGAGVTLAGAIGVVALDTAAVAVALAVPTVVAGVALIAGGLILGGLGLLGMYFGGSMVKEGYRRMKEPFVRRALNDLIDEAVKHYQAGQMMDFLKSLGKSFGGELPLINFSPDAPAAGGLLDVTPSKVVDRMLGHGFTADGVAYLLNVIGEVLISGTVRVYGYGLCLMYDLAQGQQLEKNKVYVTIKDNVIQYKVIGQDDNIIEGRIDSTEMTIPTKETLEKSESAILNIVLKRGHIQARGVLQTSLSALATRFFEEVNNSNVLLQAAKEMDKEIKATNDSMWMNIAPGMASTWTGIPKKYLEYLTKTSSPIADKLDQMRSVAMVNLSIINIGAGQEDNLLVARQQVKEIRALARKNMYKNRDSHMVVDEELEIRLGVLEDFFNALGIDNYEEESIVPNLPPELKRVNYRDASYICEQHIVLSDNLDVLLVLNQLSKGLVFISRETFLDRLIDQVSEFTEASELIELLELQPQITVQVLALKYLKLVSVVTGLDFVVCQQNLEKNTYEFLQQIVAVDKPIARIYLAVENQNNVKPVMIFIAIDNKKLEKLKEIIEKNENLEEVIDARRGLAAHYYNLANDTENVSHIAGLSCWKQAKSELESILNVKPYDINASLWYAECQLRLGKYQKALEFLKSRRIHLQDDPKYSLLLAEIFRKKGLYKAAAIYAHEKIENIVPEDISARKKKEVKITDNLLSVTREEFYKKLEMDRKYSAPSFLEANSLSEEKALYIEESVFRRKADKNVYNILSIDGGGIRGIMPALWLSELERRTHRPISHLFNLIAGTSTGGVIGAGLSVPGDNTTYAPKYRASDLLDLYVTRGRDIFAPNTRQSIFSYLPFIGPALESEKYDDSGRLTLFNSYFEEARLRDSLTELLIPTFDENDRGTKFLFTRREASVDLFKNYKLSEVLMATSAAPTFFPPYKHRRSSFLDGAIVANNPSELAFKEAVNKHKVDSRDMMLLSLGTGDCVSDPLNASTSRKGLFWALNLHKAFLDPQHGDADDTLHSSLGNRYYRWQSWMEEPIGMDDSSPETVNRLIDLARESIEEMDASDMNPLNRIVEKLEGASVVKNYPDF